MTVVQSQNPAGTHPPARLGSSSSGPPPHHPPALSISNTAKQSPGFALEPESTALLSVNKRCIWLAVAQAGIAVGRRTKAALASRLPLTMLSLLGARDQESLWSRGSEGRLFPQERGKARGAYSTGEKH